MTLSRWLVLELSEQGDSASFAELDNSLQEMLGEKSEYFIPIHSEKLGSYTSTSVLFEGYVFVKDSSSARSQLSEISDFRYFSKILESNGRVQTVDSRTIAVLKRKLRNSARKKIQKGTKVQILDGIFENLVGEVVSIEDQGREAMVRIKRLSREIIAPVPCTNLAVLKE